MTRVQKLFLQKIAKPVFTTVTVVGTITATHFTATLWGYTLGHVIAYVGIAFVYIVFPLLIIGVALWYVVDKIHEKWQDAREEVAQENETLVEVLKK